jgi:hypothetical protein
MRALLRAISSSRSRSKSVFSCKTSAIKVQNLVLGLTHPKTIRRGAGGTAADLR